MTDPKLTEAQRVTYVPIPGSCDVEADGTVTWVGPDDVEILWDDDLIHRTYPHGDARVRPLAEAGRKAVGK